LETYVNSLSLCIPHTHTHTHAHSHPTPPQKKIHQVALGNAVYMGPNRFELVQYLLKQGARFDSVTHNGTSILMSACANEDADLRVLKLLIEKTTRDEINRKIRPQTNQWRAIYTMAKIACKSGLNRGVLMRCLYERLGRTALHYAVRRGDFHCVQLLLKNGAEVSISQEFVLKLPRVEGTSEKKQHIEAIWVFLKDIYRCHNERKA